MNPTQEMKLKALSRQIHLGVLGKQINQQNQTIIDIYKSPKFHQSLEFQRKQKIDEARNKFVFSERLSVSQYAPNSHQVSISRKNLEIQKPKIPFDVSSSQINYPSSFFLEEQIFQNLNENGFLKQSPLLNPSNVSQKAKYLKKPIECNGYQNPKTDDPQLHQQVLSIPLPEEAKFIKALQRVQLMEQPIQKNTQKLQVKSTNVGKSENPCVHHETSILEQFTQRFSRKQISQRNAYNRQRKLNEQIDSMREEGQGIISASSPPSDVQLELSRDQSGLLYDLKTESHLQTCEEIPSELQLNNLENKIIQINQNNMKFGSPEKTQPFPCLKNSYQVHREKQSPFHTNRPKETFYDSYSHPLTVLSETDKSVNRATSSLKAGNEQNQKKEYEIRQYQSSLGQKNGSDLKINEFSYKNQIFNSIFSSHSRRAQIQEGKSKNREVIAHHCTSRGDRHPVIKESERKEKMGYQLKGDQTSESRRSPRKQLTQQGDCAPINTINQNEQTKDLTLSDKQKKLKKPKVGGDKQKQKIQNRKNLRERGLPSNFMVILEKGFCQLLYIISEQLMQRELLCRLQLSDCLELRLVNRELCRRVTVYMQLLAQKNDLLNESNLLRQVYKMQVENLISGEIDEFRQIIESFSSIQQRDYQEYIWLVVPPPNLLLVIHLFARLFGPFLESISDLTPNKSHWKKIITSCFAKRTAFSYFRHLLDQHKLNLAYLFHIIPPDKYFLLRSEISKSENDFQSFSLQTNPFFFKLFTFIEKLLDLHEIFTLKYSNAVKYVLLINKINSSTCTRILSHAKLFKTYLQTS